MAQLAGVDLGDFHPLERERIGDTHNTGGGCVGQAGGDQRQLDGFAVGIEIHGSLSQVQAECRQHVDRGDPGIYRLDQPARGEVGQANTDGIAMRLGREFTNEDPPDDGEAHRRLLLVTKEG